MRAIFSNSTAVRPDGQPYARARFSLELLSGTAVRSDSAHTRRPILQMVTDADGRFPADLAIETPETGAWRWRLRWPDGQEAIALIEQGDGSPIEIDDFIALARLQGDEAATPQFETLLALHGGLESATAGQVFTPAIGGGWEWSDQSGGVPEPASDGLFARLRSSGIGSWLAATSVGSALFAAVDAAAARGAIGAMPVVSPAVADNLVTQTSGGRWWTRGMR
jgi:hypothetical protein